MDSFPAKALFLLTSFYSIELILDFSNAYAFVFFTQPRYSFIFLAPLRPLVFIYMNRNIKSSQNKDEIAQVHALSHDGRGIATINSKTTFVNGGLPKEKLICKITHSKSTYQEAEALKILQPSPNRIQPECEHFGLCGGCSLQHMDLETQITLKQQTLLDQLKHFGKVTPESLLPPLSAGSVGYRRKARLGVKFVLKKNKLLVGFREKSSRYLADLSGCTVLHPAIGKRFEELRYLITSLTCYQHIPQIEIAIGDTDVALVFRHLQPLTLDDRTKLIEFGVQHQFHIYLQPNSPAPIEKIWPENSLQRISYTLPDYQLEFLFHPLDFTQINLEMNRLLVKQAIELLEPKNHEKILDLFCGIGNFTLPLSQFARTVIGVEGSLDMVARAKDNASRNSLLNADFHAANLAEPPATAPWLNSTYDKILLDPPRAGAKEILHHFKKLDAKRIVYISCNPATLARDAGELVHELGYQLKKAGVMNMFPHTSHMEAMAVFER